jgi:hypothetical protein
VPFAILALFFPGLAWLYVTRLEGRLGFPEKILLSFVLSVSILSLFTAALSLSTTEYLFYAPVVVLIVSVPILVVAVATRSKSMRPNFRIIMTPNAMTVFLCLAIYLVLVVGLLWSAPFYPTADSNDPVFHATVTEQIVAGNGRGVLLGANFAPGLHFASSVIASGLSLNALLSLRILLSLLVVSIVPLIYFAARALYESSSVATFAMVFGAFAIPADAIHFIRVGTFPNILADAIILVSIWLIFLYLQSPSFSLGLTLAILSLGGLFAHSSFLVFLGTLWVMLPVFYVAFRDKFRSYIRAVAYGSIGILAFVAALLSFLLGNLTRIAGYVSISIEPVKFQTLAWNLPALAGLINSVAIIAALIFAVGRQRKIPASLFVGTWLVLLLVGALLSSSDWRFVLFAMLPGAFLVGAMLASGLEINSNGIRTLSLTRRNRLIIASVVLLVLLASGGFPGLFSRAFDPNERPRQVAIVDSMDWLRLADCGEGVASVGLWADYRYLPILTGIRYFGDFNEAADRLLERVVQRQFGCVAVSATSPYFSSFESEPKLQMKYGNTILSIFQIVG